MVDPPDMAADTTLLQMVNTYAENIWNYVSSYDFIKSNSDLVS